MEARFASPETGPWSYLAGAYYLYENVHVAPAIYDQEFNGSDQNFGTRTHSFAVFGRLRYSVTDTLRLTAGVRWTRDEKSFAGEFDSSQALCLPFLGWSANPASVPPPPLCIGGGLRGCCYGVRALTARAPIVQWPRTPPFQGGNTGSNPVGGATPGPPPGGQGNSGPVVQFGVHAGLSSRRSRVQIPSGPPSPPNRSHSRTA